MRTSPTRQLALLLRTGRRTTLRELRAHPAGLDLGPLLPTMPGRLQTEDHRIDLVPAAGRRTTWSGSRPGWPTGPTTRSC